LTYSSRYKDHISKRSVFQSAIMMEFGQLKKQDVKQNRQQGTALRKRKKKNCEHPDASKVRCCSDCLVVYIWIIWVCLYISGSYGFV
jgi:hypothetical protein